ncbi:MarR family transcriptional regulator [Streptomyces sp. NPDC020965]|uniref:GbsR/MarR family transcriptional regulator n=1 Tax=Streptomyces sp. NPDC020965 TaxID=3365105 RepID=UPI0037ABD1F2
MNAYWAHIEEQEAPRMPGGRLTQRDRERIGAGLDDGLGYAEIARRLGRPTSTVSREVTRNGGPDGYGADRAHRSTGERARRRAPEPASGAGTDGHDRGAVRDSTAEFAEEFATMMVETGVPRMAARLLAHLVTTDAGRLTAAELVQRLRVSPASVSKAVGYLEPLSVIRRERDPRQRRESYVIDDDVWLRAWLTSARTNTLWADTAERGAELLGTTTPAGARLDRMRHFFRSLGDDMAGGTTAAVFADTLTVLAALVHTAAPRTTDQLATALGWPPDRVTEALRLADRHPDIADPLTVVRTPPDTYTTEARRDRLTETQRRALTASG